ncbi:MAG: DEAD/DEAH box helicase family protein [Acidobacteriota bacterium]|nr:MAG: DEAD/DEAH box helicase family protein [Acidobacteriota bacterium]
MITLTFDQGTILLQGLDPPFRALPTGFVHDDRVGCLRSEAYRYRETVLWLRQRNLEYSDLARKYDPAACSMPPGAGSDPVRLFDYQKEAVTAWRRMGQRGIVVLPTGSGKTVVALKSMAVAGRPTLIVVPTIDLMNQWCNRLADDFDIDQIGIIGQGLHDLRDITVITYHSAYRRMGEIGDRFGFLILDEVHHLAAPEWSEIARLSIAPFRLGLTATYDPRQSKELNEIIGPLAYWKPLRELTGKRLAEYEIIRLSVDLLPEERRLYEKELSAHLAFWQGRDGPEPESKLETLLRLQGRDPLARRAIVAWQRMRRIIAGSQAKLEILDELFHRHAGDRTIVFTASNAMAYRISELFLIPAITHQINARERKAILDRFDSGQYKAVVTSRVLNEGIDVPEARVAIVLGGSGSTREHTQRLGRILRKRAGKLAILYEIVTRGTIEAGISRHRRQTEAYAGRARKITRH